MFGSSVLDLRMLAVYVNRERHGAESLRRRHDLGREMFFLFLMVVHKNHVHDVPEAAPSEGGTEPAAAELLMAMIRHRSTPAFRMTIPFAFGIAALITGTGHSCCARCGADDVSCCSCLRPDVGIWAYKSSGGAATGLDPVERWALLPWFTATAFLHCDGQERRQHAARLDVKATSSVNVLPEILGTFMTRFRRGAVGARVRRRSDLARLSSLHGVILPSFHLLICGCPCSRRAQLDSWLSREAASSSTMGDAVRRVFVCSDDVPTLSEESRPAA